VNPKTHEIWNIHFIEQIIDTMADGVFTLDNKGRFTSWNRSMERISGYTAEEAMIRLGDKHRLNNLIGKSHAMQKVFAAINAAAASDATILIVGESGTGKELVAGAIHQRSMRTTYPLIAVNCTALTESLLEGELFGHVKGAFTGATQNRTGRFEEAEGGTVFLDEIGEISPYIQVKLLRVLQEREIERVGDSKARKVNIRIMAATNRDQIEISDLPLEIRQPGYEYRSGAIAGAGAKKVRIGRDLSRKELMKLLESSSWNKAAVARRLGVSRTAVWKYMKKWDIPLKNPAI